MIVFGLALTVMFAQAQGSDLSDLVKQLGSSSFAEREAALLSLEKLGEAALPALRAAASDPDPEVRERAGFLRAEIEAMALTQPTLVPLTLTDRPLDDALAVIGKRGLNRLDWLSVNRELERRKLTLQTPEPVPFWTAIDRLCQSAALHYVPATPVETVVLPCPQFRLFLSPGVENRHRSDSGPLRMELISLLEGRHLYLTPNSREELDGRPGVDPPPFYGEKHSGVAVGLRLLVEPRMLIHRYGDAIVTEAVDDRGNSLLRTGEPHISPRGIPARVPAQACMSHLTLRLQSPAQSVRMIKRLRFEIPVEVVARNPKPLELQLADVMSSSAGHTIVEVEKSRQDRSKQFWHLDLTISSNERIPKRLESRAGRDNGRNPSETRLVRPEITTNVLQVFDSEGRLFDWSGSGNVTEEGDGRVRVELKLDGRVPESFDEQPGPGHVRFTPGFMTAPSLLRYYEYKRAVVWAKFEFNNIAMP